MDLHGKLSGSVAEALAAEDANGLSASGSGSISRPGSGTAGRITGGASGRVPKFRHLSTSKRNFSEISEKLNSESKFRYLTVYKIK